MSELNDHIANIACVPVLLVASDYDGTLSPIVSDPSQAKPLREAVIALRTLSSLPQTHIAVVSGRALRDLARLTKLPQEVHLIGSHGSEFDPDFASSLTPEATKLREHVAQELSEIASKTEGLLVEAKPASVALHYRNADPDEADERLREVLTGPSKLEGVFTKHGKKVVELSVVATHKGDALELMRHRLGASAVIFFGDDRTDEDAFATLTGPDISVKVGPGQTNATHHVENPEEVARVLAMLCERRAQWLAGAKAVPIEQHSMLSDQRTIALVTPSAKISWLCVPRIDSPALFAYLLGGPTAGHFSITPADGSDPIEQQYMNHSLVLQSRWKSMTLTDFLDCSDGRPTRRAGRSDLIRILEGTGSVSVEFAPRLDFGRVPTRLKQRTGGLEVGDTPDPIVLHSPGVEWTIVEEGDHHTARAKINLTDQPQVFELRYGTGSLREATQNAIDRRLLTECFWSSWADQINLPEIEPELVRQSALFLKGLCYGPTGGMIAAGTTSLPEHIGGVRNWDYRYCWLRDAAMAAASLVKLGSKAEAMQYLDWVLDVIDECDSPERLRPLYTVSGIMLGSEAEITELAGYSGSRPVRVGNSASQQVQLDVFGPIVDLIALLLEHDAPLSSQHWRLVEAMVQAVGQRWHEPDHGIWEIRKPRRHHIHSKVMCWVTVDRAVVIAERFLDRQREDWVILRDRIAQDVIENGFKQDVGAFTAAYDGTDLDAAALYVGLSGLLAPDDPRFKGTVDAIEKHLRSGPTVYRYRADDGLPGFEGGFHICAAWLVEAFILQGRMSDARELFLSMVSLAGSTGMLAEQYGPKTRRALGNVPQAYSHIGIIENALRLSEM